MKRISLLALTALTTLAACREDGTERRISIDDMVPGGIQVYLNPHGITPLAAAVSLETEHPSLIELTVLGTFPVTNASTEMTPRHDSLPLLGLYENLANQVAVKITDSKNRVAYDTLTVTTGASYAGNPDVTVSMRNNSQREDAFYLADLHFGTTGIFQSRPAVFDANGNIRWQLDLSGFTDIAWPLKKTPRGTVMFVNGHHLYEYSMLGKALNAYDLGIYSAHHDWVEMPNGRFLILAYRTGKNITIASGTQSSIEDQVIEYDPVTRSVLTEWDLTQILDVDRTDLQDGGIDWFHANSVFYDERDQSIIVSGRNQGVVKIDWNNNLQWILAPHQGWGNAGRDGSGQPTAPYLLTAVDANGQPYANGVQQGTDFHPGFDWPFAQHNANVLDNGHVLLLDNGFNRRLDPTIPLSSCYSRIVEYDIDETQKTVRQDWSWGQAEGYGLYSVIISSAAQLPQTGNYLMGSGFIMATTPLSARIIELQGSTKAKVFDAELSFKNATGNGVFGWGTIDIMYRVQSFTF